MVRNIVLAIILIAQGLVWLLVDSPFDESKPKSEPVVRHKLEDIDVAEVGLVEVRDASGKTLRLEKRDGVWLLESVKGFPATAKKVEDALSGLSELSRSDYRSGKRILHENYEVDDAKGQSLKLSRSDGTPLLDLLIGKRDIKGIQGTFIRRADEDHVYVARSAELAASFPTDPRQWYSTSMMDVEVTDRDRIAELRTSCYRIEAEGQAPKVDENNRPVQPPETESVRFVYERVEGDLEAENTAPHWKVVEPTGFEELKLDDVLVKGVVGALLNLRATEIVGNEVKPEYGLDESSEPVANIVVRFKESNGETSRALRVGAEYESQSANPRASKSRCATVSHPGDKTKQSFVFTVPGTYHNYFLRRPNSFVRPPATSPERKR